MQPADLRLFLEAMMHKLSRNKCAELSGDEEELLTRLGLLDEVTCQKTLSGNLCFSTLVPLALKAIELGADPERVSKYLNWVDFEVLVTKYLSKSGLTVFRSIRFTKRRFEVDVVGVDPVSRLCLVIDCKHWKPGYRKGGKLRAVAQGHRSKVEVMARECGFIVPKYPALMRAEYLIPVIITLTQVIKGVINGTVVVPIFLLRDFIINLDYYADLFRDDVLVRNPCFLRRR
ncbi:MAG: hypothetical protein J7L51_03480 [Desulfurococcales archaeon]|nr:hypothetical protein [Desulfurococcales archaeon]